MRKYLFLTSTYLPNPGANGINTKLIINELQKRGHEITVLSTKNSDEEKEFEIIENTTIYRISKPNYGKKMENIKKNKIKQKKLIINRRLFNLFFLWKFPNFDFNQVKKTYDKAQVIIKEHDIDFVIGINKPYSNVETVMKIKNNCPEIITGIYYLDLLTGINKPPIVPQALYNFLIKKSYKKTIQKTDFILLPESGKKNVITYTPKQFINKIKIVDYPTFNPDMQYKLQKEKKRLDNRLVIFMYAGTLDKNFRNPEVFLGVVRSMHEKVPSLKLNIFGKNDLIGIEEKTNYIKNHGFKEKKIIDDYAINSNFLVNISNSYSDVVPSKIFELFSTGKPIINFVKNPNDYTLNYFQKYPLCFNYYEWKSMDLQIEKLIEFVIKNKNNTINPETLITLFEKNTPEYTASVIERNTKLVSKKQRHYGRQVETRE